MIFEVNCTGCLNLPDSQVAAIHIRLRVKLWDKDHHASVQIGFKKIAFMHMERHYADPIDAH